jgi:hypothetical protein
MFVLTRLIPLLLGKPPTLIGRLEVSLRVSGKILDRLPAYVLR